MPRNIFGQNAEEVVARYLEHEGFTVLERNYRKPYGEIDIIARRGHTIVFVEVKARRACMFDLSSVVTKSKQQKISLVAKEYIMRQSTTVATTVYRFDVALVEGVGNDAKITYIPHAFVTETC